MIDLIDCLVGYCTTNPLCIGRMKIRIDVDGIITLVYNLVLQNVVRIGRMKIRIDVDGITTLVYNLVLQNLGRIGRMKIRPYAF